MLQIVTVKGHSMEPTLANGEKLLVWKPMGKWAFKRNVIVTLDHFHLEVPETFRASPQYASWCQEMSMIGSDHYIKRIIGLAGDIITIPVTTISQDIQARIYPQVERRDNNYIWHIPEGHLFVKGDGLISTDSVTWGPIPIDNVSHIAFCRYPSLRRIH